MEHERSPKAPFMLQRIGQTGRGVEYAGYARRVAGTHSRRDYGFRLLRLRSSLMRAARPTFSRR